MTDEHRCENCEGLDPASCLFNPNGPERAEGSASEGSWADGTPIEGPIDPGAEDPIRQKIAQEMVALRDYKHPILTGDDARGVLVATAIARLEKSIQDTARTQMQQLGKIIELMEKLDRY